MCQCVHRSGMRFPIIAAQPAGPSSGWPVYFSPTKPGEGIYHCPTCLEGKIIEKVVIPPLTFFQKLSQLLKRLLVPAAGGIHLRHHRG